MKKLILFTTLALASTLIQADVTVQAVLTKKSQGYLSSEGIRITSENPMALFTLDKNDSAFNKHTLKAVMKSEKPYVFEIYRVADGAETLLVTTPELSALPGEVGLIINEEALTIVFENVK